VFYELECCNGIFDILSEENQEIWRSGVFNGEILER
jgi:hypothetical protein